MNTKLVQYSGIIFLVISLFIISFAAFKFNVGLLIMGIILLLVSIFFIFFIQTIDLYKRDKILDIKALKAQGLTIIECSHCHKQNVLEDQYCIFCGEKLEKKMDPYKRNIKLDYIHTFLRNLNVTHGIWLIYLAAKGFSFFEIGIFEGIFHLSSLSMEVPTGMVADVLGRKTSRILGILTYFLYILLLLIGSNAIIIGIGFFFCGLAYTFESGSGEALVYDSLLLTGNEQKYMKIQGIKEILFQMSSAIALFIGGYIAIIRLELNFIVMFFVFVTALIPILLMKETLQKTSTESRKFRTLMYEQYVNSTKTVFSNKMLLFLILFGALLAAPITTIFFYLQNHLTNLNISINTIGIILGVHSIAGGLGGYFAHVIERKYKEKLILYIIPIFIVISLWLLYIDSIIYIPFILLGFFDSIFYVVLSDYINRIIPSDQRATVLSFNSLAFSIVMIFLFPIVGLIGDLSTLTFAFMILASIVTLSYIFLLLVLKKSKLYNKFS